jgi:hypothetical protein
MSDEIHECPTCGNEKAKERLYCDCCEEECCEICHPGKMTRCMRCEGLGDE